MNQRHRFVSSLCACALLASPVFGAETTSVIPDSAEALGMVGGRLANLDDASAVRVSPANIVDRMEAEVLLNMAAWYGDISFDSVSGAAVKRQEPWVFPASLYAIVPIEPGKSAFGLGVSTPFGLSCNFPQNMDPRLRYTLPYESSLLAVNITPALAVKASESVSLALGLDFVYADLDIKQVYPWGLAVPGARDGLISFDGQGWGFSGYGGISWEITKHQRLAFVGKLPIKVDFEGDFETERMPAALLAAGYTRRSDFESEMEFPGSLGLGYGIDVTSRLTLGFDFQYNFNSSHDDIPLKVDNNQTLLPSDRVLLDWHDSIDIGMGASYKLNDAWTLRAGYLYSEDSQPDRNYTPSITEYDRHVFSVGVGWKGKRNSIDLAYAFLFYPTREVAGNANPVLDGDSNQQWHVLSLSITHRF